LVAQTKGGLVHGSSFQRVFTAIAAFTLALAPVFASAGSASAEPHRSTCDSTLTGGTYHFHSLTVTGACVIPSGDVTITGGLTVAPGASLTVFQPNVRVKGSVRVGKGAVLNLGCSFAMTQDPQLAGLCPDGPSSVRINGSLVAHAPLTMNLDGVVINGSVTSIGGGPGPTSHPYTNFSFKDNTVHGRVRITGWQGTWIGAVRNTIHGGLVFSHNTAVATGENGQPDGNEIISNTIHGNLVCFGNSPAAQYGDAQGAPGAAPNTVTGRTLGQCRGLTQPF
jgi:hypothetical protein